MELAVVRFHCRNCCHDCVRASYFININIRISSRVEWPPPYNLHTPVLKWSIRKKYCFTRMVNSTENVFSFQLFNIPSISPLHFCEPCGGSSPKYFMFINFNDSFPVQWTALRRSIMAANIQRKENLRNASKSKRKCGMLFSKGLTLPLECVMKWRFSMVPEQHILVYKRM